jgi:hypothetical protein
LKYSKRGRAAHPFLHHTSGRRAKDSARCSAANTSLKMTTIEPHLVCGVLSSRILLQLFRSRPFTEGTREVSNSFRDHHVFLPLCPTLLQQALPLVMQPCGGHGTMSPSTPLHLGHDGISDNHGTVRLEHGYNYDEM